MILNHDGAVRIERGFIRPADEKPQSEAKQTAETAVAGDLKGAGDQAVQDESEEHATADDEGEDDRALSDVLVRDLTAQRPCER